MNMFDRLPLLEEPFAQMLSGKRSWLRGDGCFCVWGRAVLWTGGINVLFCIIFFASGL